MDAAMDATMDGPVPSGAAAAHTGASAAAAARPNKRKSSEITADAGGGNPGAGAGSDPASLGDATAAPGASAPRRVAAKGRGKAAGKGKAKGKGRGGGAAKGGAQAAAAVAALPPLVQRAYRRAIMGRVRRVACRGCACVRRMAGPCTSSHAHACNLAQACAPDLFLLEEARDKVKATLGDVSGPGSGKSEPPPPVGKVHGDFLTGEMVRGWLAGWLARCGAVRCTVGCSQHQPAAMDGDGFRG